jgi:hypothetical protein
MSKDRKIDDAELAKIAGAGKESDLASGSGSGSSKFNEAPGSGGGGGTPGSPDGVEDQDQDGGESTFGN